MILLSRAEEILLLAVYKLKDDAYGVTIREQVYTDTKHYWAFGAVYKTLKKMSSKDFVDKVKSEPLSERGGRSKYYYVLTKAGLNALEEISNVNKTIWNGVEILSYDIKSK